MSDKSFSVDMVKFGLAGFGLVELDDGRLLSVVPVLQGNISKDRGRTWEEGYPFVTGSGEPIAAHHRSSVVRMASGKIGVAYKRPDVRRRKPGNITPKEYAMFFTTSEDEGGTWSEPHRINFPGAWIGLLHDPMMQTRSGRLILPVVTNHFGRRSEHDAGETKGQVNGHIVGVEAHGHYPELDIGFVYYSDDDGQTWDRSDNDIIGWPDDGRHGIYPTEEPTVAETKDGRLLMFSRSTLGRVLESWSDDDGLSWTRGLPNVLCNSLSPVRLRTIATTGDLHCVWNQVTREEIHRGMRRSRLTSAISKDSGKTWTHFTTLDCADSLDKSPYQEPDPTIEFVVSRQECGELPANWCIYRYANVWYVGDMAYIAYDRESFKYPGSPKRQHVLRAIPIDWLYDDARTDLSLSNDVPEAAESAEGESIED